MQTKELIPPEVNISFDSKRRQNTAFYTTSSSETYEILKGIYDYKTIDLFEQFYVLFLNRRNRIIAFRELSRGGTFGTYVDIRIMMLIAINCNSSSIIVSHNHPSGQLSPSGVDKKLTNRIRVACTLFDMKLLDHLIVTSDGYYSFVDEGLI